MERWKKAPHAAAAGDDGVAAVDHHPSPFLPACHNMTTAALHLSTNGNVY